MIARVASLVIAVAALASVSGPRADAPPAPVLIVRAAPASARADAPADDDIATALLLTSLSAEARARLVEQLAYTASRLEGRLSPIVEDFGDDSVEPMVELRHDLAALAPSLNAAKSLSAREWHMPGLSARVAASCADADV